jgi:hypothetical protein
VSSVSLPLASVINGFRQAVIDANPESSLDASQLKIYKNKTAFDGKEETLEDDCLVSGLGSSDKEALVVLVPTTTVSNCMTKQPQSKREWGFWGLAFLMSHELDAINCQEWRMLPLLSFSDDNVGYQVFTILHVPVFAAILLGIHSNKNWNRILFQFSLFNVIHTGLHTLAVWCPRNQFSSPLSWSLIIGGGFCGAMHVFQNLNINFKRRSSNKKNK